jgi:L-cysteine desulfidase
MTAHQEQKVIGWENLFHGFLISKTWRDINFELFLPSKSVAKAIKLHKQIITAIWVYTKKIWCAQIDILHGNEEEMVAIVQLRVNITIRQIYEDKDLFQQDSNRKFINMPIKTILR